MSYFQNMDFRKLLRSTPKSKEEVPVLVDEEAEGGDQPEAKIPRSGLFSKFTQKEPAIDEDSEASDAPDIDLELTAYEEEEDDISEEEDEEQAVDDMDAMGDMAANDDPNAMSMGGRASSAGLM
jgi:hypothetical protein